MNQERAHAKRAVQLAVKHDGPGGRSGTAQHLAWVLLGQVTEAEARHEVLLALRRGETKKEILRLEELARQSGGYRRWKGAP